MIDAKAAIDARLAGATLEAIAQDQGVSIEAIRQVLLAEGGPTPNQAKLAQRESLRLEHIALGQRIGEELDSGGPQTAGELAQTLGVSKTDVAAAWPDDRLSLRAHKHTGSSRQEWMDQQILICLQTAAVDGRLTAAGYAAYRKSNAPHWPSPALVTTRFGGWANACEAAGLKHGKRSPKAGPTPMPDSRILSVVHRFLSESELGSIEAYERWRKGEPKAPSVPTIRLRFGGWNRAKELAVSGASQAAS